MPSKQFFKKVSKSVDVDIERHRDDRISESG